MIDIGIILIIIGAVYCLIASINDYKTMEVPDYLTITLLIMALVVRASYSIITNEWGVIMQGLIGLGIFLVLGNLFYYGRVFGGGDAKLMIGLGAIIGISNDTMTNLKGYLAFIITFLIIGAVYGIIASIVIMIKEKKKSMKKELRKEIRKNKNLVITGIIIGIIILVPIIIIKETILYLIPLLIIITPVLLSWAAAYERTYMIKTIITKELQPGDVITKNIKIKSGKTIKASFEGITKKEIMMIKKARIKNVEIKNGIPFTLTFLITIIAYYYIISSGRI